jgi:hypothetical protein
MRSGWSDPARVEAVGYHRPKGSRPREGWTSARASGGFVTLWDDELVDVIRAPFRDVGPVLAELRKAAGR